MAVSQPRPPDRVDAALEKVAPLRYLEAHECARPEHALTRYYHHPLSCYCFLSYKTRFQLNFADIEVYLSRIKRYVVFVSIFFPTSA